LVRGVKTKGVKPLPGTIILIMAQPGITQNNMAQKSAIFVQGN